MIKETLKCISKVAAIVTCLLGVMACPNESDPDYVHLSSQQLQFGWQQGSQQTLTIESNTRWTMEGPNGRIGWLNATSTVGESGTVTITFTVTQDNPEETPRSETITITAGDDKKVITVTQAGCEITYFIISHSKDLEFDKKEASKDIVVESNDEWTVTSSDDSWCKVVKANEYTARVSVSASTLASNREAVVTISGKKSKEKAQVKVLQHGDSDFDITDYDSDTDIDNNIPITMSVTPTSLSRLKATASTQEFSITGNDNWTASIDVDWCRWSTTAGSKTISGEGDAKLLLYVDENLGVNERKANITFKGEFSKETITVPITQEKTVYTLQLNATSHEFESTGGTVSVNVSSNDSWTVTSNKTWCTVSPSNSKGDGIITITVDKNTTVEQRSAIITVKGTYAGTYTVNVTQKAANNFDRDDFDSDKNID